jgi:hypothetical protein
MTVAGDPITMTLQEIDDPTVHLPDAFHQKPGTRIRIEFKRSGQVRRVVEYACAAFSLDGETYHRWRRISARQITA